MIESPSIGGVQGKVWGDTQLAFAFNGTSAHVIRICKGGYCSKHSHVHRWNRFMVIRGRLAIRIWHDGVPDETIIGSGEISDVPPGIRHEFEALDEVDAIEFYWTVLDDSDINRHGTMGGIK